MGASSSRPCRHLIVTLDALGTIYRFKEPFAVQYIKAAQKCGLKGKVETKALEGSFRQAFKHHNLKFANYGKGKMESPEVWWDSLVRASFKPLVGDESIPPDLGRRLYNHFSTRSAYEFFPDFISFLETIKRLRRKYSDPRGPMITLGIITNSDPRVRKVLTDLGLRIGDGQCSLDLHGLGTTLRNFKTSSAIPLYPRSPFFDAYDSQNDIDFLTTSYEAGYEKPDIGIFNQVNTIKFAMPLSRYEKWALSQNWNTLEFARRDTEVHKRLMMSTTRWIHIGDDYEKDFVGAKNAGWEALWLARGLEKKKEKGSLPEETVTNLVDAAEVVRLLTQQEFGDADNPRG